MDFCKKFYFCPTNLNSRTNSPITMEETDGFLGTRDFFERYSVDYSHLDSDYLFSRLTSTDPPARNLATAPTRMSGVVIVLTLKGTATLDVNLNSYVLSPNTVAVLGPECLIHVRDVDWKTIDAYIFIVSKDFLKDVNLDLEVLNSSGYTSTPAAVLELTPEESELMTRYFDIIHFNTRYNSDKKYIKSISRSLLAACVYQLIQFAKNHSFPETRREPHSRRTNYVKDFMSLVHKHHRRERAVTFYASRLFISPKYLSLIVKEVTGKSAAQWIDEFVILEAKNLLRFSGMNVQQIAYELNFPNQSSFGKYFKHITGMSPTEYQRS